MLVALLHGLTDHLRRALARRHALAALRALDDRMLRDIGLDRSDIPAAVETGMSKTGPTPAERPAERPAGESRALRLASCPD